MTTTDTDEMREAWRAFTGPSRDHGFDTWLARVRRDAQADAWDEGYAEATTGSDDPFANPYRYETED